MELLKIVEADELLDWPDSQTYGLFPSIWANPDLFLFIFVLFNHKIFRKKLGFSGIFGGEGEHADHLTTATAQI